MHEARLSVRTGSLVSRLDPAGRSGRENDQMVSKLLLVVCRKKRQQQFGDTRCQWGMNSDADHSRMTVKRQENPIAEILVERDESASVVTGPVQYLRIVRPGLANLTCANNIVTVGPQRRREVRVKHLIQVEFHSSLTVTGRVQFPCVR